MEGDAIRESVREYIRKRVDTDHIIPIWLPFLPLILILTGVLSLLAVLLLYSQIFDSLTFSDVSAPLLIAAFTIFFLLLVAGVIVNIYVIYKLVWRRNEHFKRQQLLFAALIELLKRKTEKNSELREKVSVLERRLKETEVDEEEKNAFLWAILQLVPYAGTLLLLYVFHFLNADFRKHEYREIFFVEDLSRLLSSLGIDFSPKLTRRVPERNTVLYTLLTIVTMGIFALYWIYTLAKDPNEHFRQHEIWENELLRLLNKI